MLIRKEWALGWLAMYLLVGCAYDLGIAEAPDGGSDSDSDSDTGSDGDTDTDADTDTTPVDDCTDQPDFTLCEVVTAPDRSYDICIGGECVSPGCGDSSCNPPSPHFKYPDTNQRYCTDESSEIPCPGTAGGSTCSSTPFCGQDAQYGWDANHEESDRFTRTVPASEQPVIFDNATNLMWQGCMAELSGSSCESGEIFNGNWDQALAYCDGLDWGSYQDWRLPDLYELSSIFDYGRHNPAIDVSIFMNFFVDWYWTSTYSTVSDNSAWYVNFYDGMPGSVATSSGDHKMLCVRGLPGQIDERFELYEPVAEQPCVIDNVLEAEWQACVAGKQGSVCSVGSAEEQTWEEALEYCESLDWGGHVDWRLPNIFELFSIVNPRKTSPLFETEVFLGTPSGQLWSSTTFHASYVSAKSIDYQYANMGVPGKTSSQYTRCLRDLE